MKTEKIPILIGILLTILFGWLGFSYFSYIQTNISQRTYHPLAEAFEVMDLRFNDMKYKFRARKESKADVVLVAIDDASVREIGRFPWSRELIAQMTDELIKNGAKSVGFDAIFSESERESSGDAAFGKVITEHPEKVILGTFSENRFDFKPYQDLCVTEAFLKTGGDQIVKINPGFSIDDVSNPVDDLNWSPVFSFIFQNLTSQTTKDFLEALKKKDVSELSFRQKNNLHSLQNSALFDYCKSWLTNDDVFTSPENVKLIEPVYMNVAKTGKVFEGLSFPQVVEKIKSAYASHPIPQYGEWTPNIPEVQNPATYTASFIADLDSDGYVRRYPLFYRSGSRLGSSFIPSLALQSFLLSGPYRAELKMGLDKRGDRALNEFTIYDTSKEPELKIASLPVDGSGRMLINYYGSSNSLPYVSAKELFSDKPTVTIEEGLLDPKTHQKIIHFRSVDKAAFFKDKNVLVGATAVGIYDLRSTPLDPNYPGPEVHLTMLANLLEHNFLKYAPNEGAILPWIVICFGLLLTLAWCFASPLVSFLI